MTEIGKIPHDKGTSEFPHELKYKKLPDVKGVRSAYVATPDTVGTIALGSKSTYTFPATYNYDFTKSSIMLKLTMAAATHAYDVADYFGGVIDSVSVFLGPHKIEETKQYSLMNRIEHTYGKDQYMPEQNQYEVDSSIAGTTETGGVYHNKVRRRYVSENGFYVPLISGFLRSGKIIPCKLLGQPLKIEIQWASIQNSIISAVDDENGVHSIAASGIHCEQIMLDAISEGKLIKHMSKMGGLQLPYRTYEVHETTTGANTSLQRRFFTQKSYLNKVLFALRKDADITPQLSHKKCHTRHEGVTTYNISIGNTSMSGQVGNDFGNCHMYRQLLTCFPNTYPLSSNSSFTGEQVGDVNTTDATTFIANSFLMGVNLESSVENKEPTLSGNEDLRNGNAIVFDFTRTGTAACDLLALVEHTAIMKMDNRGQIMILN